ncbi:unnamed protein product [Porites evermanni]|uniref:Beta-1,4-galactosyltransferase n=1 Tax=Porites evermanni TaxID=104178 RepID=A0ABN8M7R9_9CNID|nr:unnamed protein product [Porites evermanni]
MPAFKAVYGILLFVLVLYLLIYGFIVRKLFVVKIYFETEKRDNILLQKDSAFDSTLSDKQLSSGVELSSWNKSSLRNLVERIPERLDSAKSEILSFLQDLGVKVNEADISSSKKPTTAPPPQVNPNGASLPNLIRKMGKRFNFSADKPCPKSHLSKAVRNTSVTVEEVAKELKFVVNGGQWKPNCQSRKQVAIVVPFRNRHEHLYIFLRHMHQFLKWQLLEYRIFVIEQADNERFNRGMLMNVGFSEAMKAGHFSCVIFHDVDLLPEDARNDYGCPSSPRHMSTAVSSMEYKLIYKTLFGGVEGFWSEHFRTVNGFPNRFWGWGGEDDDLFVRITEKQLSLTRPAQMIGRYAMLSHLHTEDDKNPQRFEQLRVSETLIDEDGLNTLTYSVRDYQEMPLYTMISVSLR